MSFVEEFEKSSDTNNGIAKVTSAWL